MPSGEAVITSRAILFWSTAFSVEKFQCSIRTGLLAITEDSLGECTKGLYVYYNTLQANGGDKDHGRWSIVPVENRTCPSRLEESEVGNFCYCGSDSVLCPVKTQSAAAQPPRWKPWPKICATQTLGPIWSYPINTLAVQPVSVL